MDFHFKIDAEAQKLGLLLVAYPAKNIDDFFLCRSSNTNSVFFDDPGFLTGNRFQRFTQISRVLQSDIGNDRNQWMTNIGGIQPAA